MERVKPGADYESKLNLQKRSAGFTPDRQAETHHERPIPQEPSKNPP